ncbi:response regulator [Aerosakkonemataceae cyanobacterium BLCC-F154]|uniref:Response regulator n=1 Tax=Floridaenema fluviatile BLCC-F154 TaxID=3153640 RepID=A0ABV4YKW3_9CYAN
MTKHLLVIDDEQDIRDVVKVSLEEFAGWQVETANSGKEGLQKVKIGKWDAILLDVSMPDMDGFSVFEQLQANSATKTIPVVLLTAKVLPSDRRRFMEMGVTGVITKPFNPVTVWNQVAEILQW